MIQKTESAALNFCESFFVVVFSLLGRNDNQPRTTNIGSSHNQKKQHTCAAQVVSLHNQTRQKTSLKQKSHLKQRKVVLDPTPSASTQRNKKLRRPILCWM
jgi:hypothetical protein